MKTRWLSCLLVVWAISLGSAQLNQVYFQQVVPMTAFSLTQLKSYTQQYFQSEDYTQSEDSALVISVDSTSFRFPQQFMLYNRSALKHPVGLLTYRATVDLKEGKLRYAADSIYVQNYTRNRYSRYVADKNSPQLLSEWLPKWRDKQQDQLEEQIQASLEDQLQQLVDALHRQKTEQINAANLEDW
ncbi:hypothetical protein [Tunicatimonas pelagia]|uniref:hypothetical protein n=1 Tax=Tunicatimonas pelagia TaxID=931531 RepID=UPI0026659890|nr:hypothetical protein [Tunicatimonas pelagia]WKN40898.1 hypothetical protein P0M28_17835 [Tunicatimonas pelagia]